MKAHAQKLSSFQTTFAYMKVEEKYILLKLLRKIRRKKNFLSLRESKEALQKKIINILNVVDDIVTSIFPPFSPPSLKMFVNAPQEKKNVKNFSYIHIFIYMRRSEKKLLLIISDFKKDGRVTNNNEKLSIVRKQLRFLLRNKTKK